jgi:endonuclease-3 related protein
VTRRRLLTIYRRLERHYGPTGWWPGDSAFEIAVGAILTQNTAWTNVEQAIANLKRDRLLAPKKIAALPDGQLHTALKPSGYFRIKAQRLRSFCEFLIEKHAGSMKRMATVPLEDLRAELLDVHGIGPETADDILLYACEKPVFVIDAYTRRVLHRHGHVAEDINYHDLQKAFHDCLPADVSLFKEYHALIVYLGKDYCRPKPRCEACPLRPLLKPGQPCGVAP